MSKSQHKRIAAQTTDELPDDADLVVEPAELAKKIMLSMSDCEDEYEFYDLMVDEIAADRAQTEARVRAELAAHEQAWIFVHDRPPPENERVLLMAGEVIYAGWRVGDKYLSNAISMAKTFRIPLVLKWMHLPGHQMKMLVDKDWLRRKNETEPEMDVEAGYSPAPDVGEQS